MSSVSAISFNNTSFCSRIGASLNPYNSLEGRVRAIATTNFEALALSLEQKTDLKRAIRVANGIAWPATRMTDLLKAVPKETIRAFIQELLSTESDKEIDYYLERCLHLLDSDTLLDISGFKTAENASAWYLSRVLIKDRVMKSRFRNEGKVILKEFMIEAKHFFHQLMHIMIVFTGISELSRKKTNRFEGQLPSSFEAQSKMDNFLKFVGIPAIIFGSIYQAVPFFVPAVALTATVSIVGLTVLLAYNRYFKPCPIDVDGLKNLSIELLKNKDFIYPRMDILSQIERAFQGKKGVILVGDSGSGKSQIALSFVEQVMAGKLCSFIRDPQIFSANAASFRSLGPSQNSLKELEDQFHRYGDQAVFFFDEFHSLFETDSLQGGTTVNELKTFCEEFRFVIGATTTKEYDEFIRDKIAIAGRRFEVIRIGALADDKIKITVSQTLEHANSNIPFDAQAIDCIVKNAGVFNPKTSKIDTAQKLMKLAIQKMTEMTFPELEEEIRALEEEIGYLEQQIAQASLGHDLTALINPLESKREALKTLKETLDKKNQQVQRIQKVEAYYRKLKFLSYKLVSGNKLTASLERKWQELHAKIAVVEEFIVRERVRLGFPGRLDAALIEKLLSNQPAPSLDM